MLTAIQFDYQLGCVANRHERGHRQIDDVERSAIGEIRLAHGRVPSDGADVAPMCTRLVRVAIELATWSEAEITERIGAWLRPAGGAG